MKNKYIPLERKSESLKEDYFHKRKLLEHQRVYVLGFTSDQEKKASEERTYESLLIHMNDVLSGRKESIFVKSIK